MLKEFLLVLGLSAVALGLRPFERPIPEQRNSQGAAGDPLYLTPYIQAGDIATAKALAEVVDPLPQIGTQLESYSGFLTVNEATDSNMFFWFFPATDVDPATAPVVIWLQGGPGGSSLFGLLEIHGPIQAVFDDNGDTIGEINPYSWAKQANMLYIDNPVGAGYSYSDASGLPVLQDDVATDLYECLTQWFTLFPEYQANDFYAFGESYGGKFVPTIAKKIHDENPTAAVPINLVGIGIGDGFISPPETAVYADLLFEVGLVDEITHDELLVEEQQVKDHIANEEWYLAWNGWNQEFSHFMTKMGCFYYYDFTICSTPDEENNYSDYVQYDETRLAIHVGDRPFGTQSGDVYNSMIDDFMRGERDTLEFLLDRYNVLIYDGNLDIICNHGGILEMFAAMQTWSGIDEYYQTDRHVYRSGGETAGYIKRVQNLRMFVMRNAGHMVPRSQPAWALDMFNDFIAGTL